MNWLDKFITRRAKKIALREDEKLKSSQQDQNSKYEYRRLKKQECQTYFENRLEEYKQAALNKKPTNIAPGMKAVVNIFNLGISSENGWDNGSKAYTTCIQDDDLGKGISVKITDVYLDTSKVDDKIDRYLSNDFDENISLVTAWSEFIRKYCPSNYYANHIFDRIGYYWAAKFETNITFQPRWGLNVCSFLVEGESGYQETLEIMELEIEKRHLKKKTDDLISEMNTKIYKFKQQVNQTNLVS